MRRLRGSVSLLFCLLIPCLFLFAYSGVKLAQLRLRQADRSRALYAAAELCLAQYERKLWQDFALWAFEAADVKLGAAESLLGKDNGKLSFSAAQPLWEKGELKRQILRQMRLRAPAFLAISLWQKLQSRTSSERFFPELRRLHEAHSAERAYLEGREEVLRLGGREEVPALPAGDGLKGKEEEGPDPGSRFFSSEDFDRLDEKDKEMISRLLRYFGKKIMPVYEAAGSHSATAANAFSPSLLEELAKNLDKLMDQGIGLNQESVLLAEYVLQYFPARVHIERTDWKVRELSTPDGRLHKVLAKARPSEAEIIAAGIKSKILAEKTCDALILGLRFLPRYIAAFQNPELQARYLRWATWSSTFVSLLSVGSVKLPPEVLRYFIQAADSLHLADKDLRNLHRGEALPFWPQPAAGGKLNLNFFYRDYLRLILWTRTEDGLIRDIERLIRKASPGDYYCSAQLSWQGKEGGLSVRSAYQDAEEKEP